MFFNKSYLILKKNQIGFLIILTELFMLSDRSLGFKATHDFYERKIDSFEDFGIILEEILPMLRVSNIGLLSLLDLLKNPYDNSK